MKKVSGNVYKTSGGSYYEDPLLALVKEIETLIVDYKGKEVRVGSGYSDQQRIDFLDKDNRPSIIEASLSCSFLIVHLCSSVHSFPAFQT